MNTIYKHREILANHSYVYETSDVFCVWQNAYHQEKHRVDIRLDFFEKQGKHYLRSSEEFSECAYARETIEEMLMRVGLHSIQVFDDCSFSSPKPESQRVIYVARK